MGIPILGDIISAVKDLASEAIVDKDKRAELNVRLTELADKAAERDHEELVAQIKVNEIQAAHASMFVAGARPALMWCGVAMLAWEGFANPFLGMFVANVPHVDKTFFEPLLWFLGGLCGLRGFEKVKGVARDVIAPKAPAPSLPAPVVPALPAPAEPPKKKRRFRL